MFPAQYKLLLQKCGFLCTVWIVLSSHGTVMKCTAAIFFPTEDSGMHTQIKTLLCARNKTLTNLLSQCINSAQHSQCIPPKIRTLSLFGIPTVQDIYVKALAATVCAIRGKEDGC